MSPVQWGPAPPSFPRLDTIVVAPKLNCPMFVSLLGPAISVNLHWLEGSRKRSMPCLGKECPYHSPETHEHFYAPCLLWRGKNSDGKEMWAKAVLSLGEKSAYRAAELQTRTVYRVIRVGYARGPLEFGPLERAIALPEIQVFDVRPILLRMWGLDKWIEQPAVPEGPPSLRIVDPDDSQGEKKAQA